MDGGVSLHHIGMREGYDMISTCNSCWWFWWWGGEGWGEGGAGQGITHQQQLVGHMQQQQQQQYTNQNKFIVVTELRPRLEKKKSKTISCE